MQPSIHFDYDDQDSYLNPSNPIVSHEDAVRMVTTVLPADFYDRTPRSLSLTSWLPWPGQSTEFVHDDDFVYYCDTQDVERVPNITSYHGHILLMPTVRIQYLGRSRKFLKLNVTFVRRRWNKDTQQVDEDVWLTVPAVQGDNNLIRLLQELPGETDLELDQCTFFTDTPDEMDQDFETRLQRAYGDVLAELV